MTRRKRKRFERKEDEARVDKYEAKQEQDMWNDKTKPMKSRRKYGIYKWDK